MGDVFGIIEKISHRQFRIQYLITGVEQVVTLDPDKEALYYKRTILDTRPMACPFLREQESGLFVCTVYQTRTELCRIYLCTQT
jgi:Fe-S-cluster containining protein